MVGMYFVSEFSCWVYISSVGFRGGCVFRQCFFHHGVRFSVVICRLSDDFLRFVWVFHHGRLCILTVGVFSGAELSRL